MKPDTYYARNRAKRLAYQKANYAKNKARIARKLELEPELEPEKYAARIRYQREYYIEHREDLLAKRRAKYKAARGGREIGPQPEKLARGLRRAAEERAAKLNPVSGDRTP